MDAALQALVDRVENGGDSPAGVYLSLSSGILVAGSIAPAKRYGERSRDVLRQQVGASLAALHHGSDPEREGNKWDQMQARPLWEALATEPGSGVITIVDASVTRPGSLPLKVPAARISGDHVAAWWMTDQAE